MSNPKFNVGDEIRRVGVPLECIIRFDTLTVKTLSKDGVWLGVAEYSSPTGDKTPFLAKKFELVQDTPEQPVLTPQEVFTAILEGTPLEYRASRGSHWHTLSYPENVNIASFKLAEYRKQVQTVTLSGTVPKPVPHDAIEVTAKVYTIYLSTMQVSVVNGRYAQAGGLYWRTQVEAEQALDVLTKCFSTVPVLD